MNFNKAFVLGNITKDIETRSLPSGQQVVSFTVATNRSYTDASGQKKEEAEFHNIVAFGKLADIISRYMSKGSLIFIVGRIKTRNWTDQQGQKHWKTEIIAEEMQMGPKSSGVSGGGGNNYQPRSFGSSSEKVPAKEPEIPVIEENSMPSAEYVPNTDEIDVKDIPF